MLAMRSPNAWADLVLSLGIELRTIWKRMATLQLPQEAVDGIQQIAAIDSEIFARFIDELDSQLSVSLAIESNVDAAVGASKALEGMTVDARKSLSQSIINLHFLASSADKTVDLVLRDVVESYFRHFPDAATDVDAIKNVELNISAILNLRVLRASVKAWALSTDNNSLVLSSKILTDIRPIFDDNLAGPNLGSVITHTLRFNILTEGKHQSVYMVADSGDLRKLRDVIDRALSKETAIVAKSQVTSNPFGPMLTVVVDD
jgi:hypothetical protein